MDGTLTTAVHDFQAIAEALGLSRDRPILETLAEMPDADQAPLRARLADMELDLARQASLAPGVHALLTELSRRGARLAILTRNTRDNARVTLEAVGLTGLFPPEAVLGRDEAAPKPAPDGVHVHLDRWALPAHEAVMVGDYLFDLQAGRRAGAATVYVDPEGKFPFAEEADLSVRRLDELLTG